MTVMYHQGMQTNKRLFIMTVVAVLGLATTAVRAAEVAPSDIPSRCTVGIRATAGMGGFVGTGSIISPYGYILTSTTVVPSNATEIEVFLSDGQVRPGTLLQTDEKTEFALIRIDPPQGKPLPAFTIRNSKSLELGEVVITMSNLFHSPRGPEQAESVGFLSGRYRLDKERAEQHVYVGEVLETTAAANPGSDGGPLLDGSGQLLGVLSLNVSDIRWLGVAVPVEVNLDRIQKAIKADLVARHLDADGALTVVEKPGKPLFPEWEARAKRFQAAAKKVSASVVAIEVEREGVPAKPPAVRLRGLHPEEMMMSQMQTRPNGPVTGVVVDRDGWIATSYFNIEGKLKSLKVVRADGSKVDAKVVGWDQDLDLALLKADGSDWPAVELAKQTKVGTFICALGRSPDPTQLTLTAGIVSAMNRGDYGMLQFDAKANFGNTGGPLIGLDGRCVGIITGITSNGAAGQSSGVAFAVGYDQLPAALKELKAGKQIVTRPHTAMGIMLGEGTVDLRGIPITGVMPGSAAAKAGIKPGDALIKFDGTEIEGPGQLVALTRLKKPGDKVKVVVRREAQELQIELVLGEVKQ